MVKNMKKTYQFRDIIYSRTLLYFFLIISVLDLFYFTNAGDTWSIFTFVLVGFLTSFFSKNMIIILVISLVTTHLLKFGIKSTIDEGFDNSMKKNSEEEGEGEGEEKEVYSGEEGEKKKDLSEETMTDLKNFTEVQDEILGSLKKMEPLIAKAEGFIEKYGDKIPDK
jgi:hypothetical protein